MFMLKTTNKDCLQKDNQSKKNIQIWENAMFIQMTYM